MVDNPPGNTAAEDGSDNHLRLNPSNPDVKDAIASWEDGKTYSFQVTVRQVSPGEYEVIKAVPGEAAPEEGGEGAEPPPGAAGEAAGAEEEPNPAMRRLMAKQGKA